MDERESFINATFAAAKDGGDEVGLTKRGKGVKISRDRGSARASPLGQYTCGESS